MNYNDTTVTNGTTYYYEIKAVNKFGESSNSNIVNATLKTSVDNTNLPSVTTTTSSSTSTESNTASASKTSTKSMSIEFEAVIVGLLGTITGIARIIVRKRRKQS